MTDVCSALEESKIETRELFVKPSDNNYLKKLPHEVRSMIRLYFLFTPSDTSRAAQSSEEKNKGLPNAIVPQLDSSLSKQTA